MDHSNIIAQICVTELTGGTWRDHDPATGWATRLEKTLAIPDS